MGGKWHEVVRLTFKAPEAPPGALEVRALAELGRCQTAVTETAKALWRKANPSRDRLPAHFEQRGRLYLRRVEGGSAVAPLEVYVEEPEVPELFEREPEEISRAVELVWTSLSAIEQEGLFPEEVPRSLIPVYAKLGEGLTEGEEIEFAPVGKPPARISPKFANRWEPFLPRNYEDHVQLVGEVLEADVRQGRFQLWVDEKTGVTVPFSEEQEIRVTTALRDHQSLRLEIWGNAEFFPDGSLFRVCYVEGLEVTPVERLKRKSELRSLWQELSDIANRVPEQEWERLPRDLSDRVDSYIYEAPDE